MENYIKNSSFYIAIGGDSNIFDKDTKNKIYNTFERIFENSFNKISDIHIGSESEMIYEIKTPVINDENLTVDFLKKTEKVLEELSEFNPHFTQYERGDN